MSGIPQGSILGLVLFYIFVGEIQCTVRKFAIDSKLCGAVKTLQERDTIQRDPDRLEG